MRKRPEIDAKSITLDEVMRLINPNIKKVRRTGEIQLMCPLNPKEDFDINAHTGDFKCWHNCPDCPVGGKGNSVNLYRLFNPTLSFGKALRAIVDKRMAPTVAPQRVYKAPKPIQNVDMAPIEVRDKTYRAYPKFKDGECYIPLVYVASAVNPDLYANNTQTGVLTIPLQGCYAGATISVPYSLGSPGVYKSATFEAGNYYANLGEGATDDVYWTDNFTIGEGNACYVPASELSRYTGWYIYSDGKSVHVVTDETDVSDLFVLDTRGNRTAENQTINDGNTIIKYTDPNDEKLYNMMRDDGTLDENGDFVVDYEDSTTGIIEKQIEERGGDNE